MKNKKDIKKIVEDWIIQINQEAELPKEIVALNFGLFEPYGIELIGANEYDSTDDDWACQEDFRVETSIKLPISEQEDWEDVLECIQEILKDIIKEHSNDLPILNVNHITTGFSDGDLVVVK